MADFAERKLDLARLAAGQCYLLVLLLSLTIFAPPPGSHSQTPALSAVRQADLRVMIRSLP